MDTSGIDIPRLEEAIVVFYNSNPQQAVTHDWLTKAQTSTQAWQFCWELMRLDRRQEVQFFGAITLHSKLMKHWHEVPLENHEELKHKIMEHIIRFANGPKLVLNRLCIALSVFMVHMLPEWPTAMEDTVRTLQDMELPNVSKETQWWIILEILQAIPEEMQAIYSSVKRATIRHEVSLRTPIVIEVAEVYLKLKFDQKWNQMDYGNMICAVKCMDSWIKQLGFPLENCLNISEILLKIVNKCYWPCSADGCMSPEEVELSEACLKTLQSIIIQPDCQLFPKTAYLLIKMFVDHLSEIALAEWKEDNNNEDIAVQIYTLLISSVERHSSMLMNGITKGEPETAELLGLLITEIMRCTDKPGVYPVEESCSNMALGFWYMLQDEVFGISNEAEKIKCLAYIKPLYAHLTRVLVKKAEYPDQETIVKFNSDDLEAFRCYRQDICDTFMYCFDVLHDDLLGILGLALEEAIAYMQHDPTKWTKLEASIFCFQAVAEHFGGRECVHIPKLMRVMSEIPYDNMNVKLLGTSLETLGAYCQWLKENPAYIPGAIELLVRGLNSKMSAQATLGLKDLCRNCQVQMKPYAEPLLNACHEALAAGRMKNTDCVRLMFSIGKLMSLLAADDILKYLDIIVSPCFQELQAICQGENKSAENRSRTVFRLNMISTLFQSLNTDLDDEDDDNQVAGLVDNVQPVLLVMQKTMPIFCQIAETWKDDADVLEAACLGLKQAIVNLKGKFKPMLQDLCLFIVAILQAKFCGPAIDIAKTAIVLFHKIPGCSALMQQLLLELIGHSFKLFASIHENAFSEIADTLDTFYASLAQLIKKLPEALHNKDIAFEELLFYALKAMTLPENGPIRSSILFLHHFIMHSRNYPAMTQAVLTSGENILRTAIICVAALTPRQQVEKLADVFLAINKKYPAEMALWLNAVMQPADFPTPTLNKDEKRRVVSLIIREKTNKRLLQKHLAEFAVKARGLAEAYHPPGNI